MVVGGLNVKERSTKDANYHATAKCAQRVKQFLKAQKPLLLEIQVKNPVRDPPADVRRVSTISRPGRENILSKQDRVWFGHR